MSIKAGTWTKRTKKHQPVRRKTESRAVPLQANWSNFLALSENKADLANFLSEELIMQAPSDQTVMVVAGGFDNEETVECNHPELDISDLRASHEEADTRIVLHAIHCANKSGAVNILVSARDTDVLILLLAHFHEIKVDTWMSAGTAKTPKCIPVHEVYKCLPEGSSRAILPFHTLTGYDTTSFFYGQSKQSAYKIFRDNLSLIETLGENELTEEKARDAEIFVCKLYGQNVHTTDEARMEMYHACNSPEMLPPTSDALTHHIKRTHYQSLVWKQSNVAIPELPSATESGWREHNQKLLPVLMTKSAIPRACAEMTQCGCKKGCHSMICKCKQARLPCTKICACDKGVRVACLNRQ